MTVWSWATSSWRCVGGERGEERRDGFGLGEEEVVAVAGDGEEGGAGGRVEGGEGCGGCGDLRGWGSGYGGVVGSSSVTGSSVTGEEEEAELRRDG